METLMFWTGVAFWLLVGLLGLYLLVDTLLWKMADILIKRWKLENDLYAFVKHRWEKRSGNYPA